MTEGADMDKDRIKESYNRLKMEAESAGYHLHPDESFAEQLVWGLLRNEQRYGYPSCPCRLAAGKMEEDLDIICPCDYRDPDLDEYGSCYCALYVTSPVPEGKMKAGPVPERRPPRDLRPQFTSESRSLPPGNLKYPVHRCRVCGYLCARNNPPESCPVCHAGRKRFERFL